jgi:hypothetical protein
LPWIFTEQLWDLCSLNFLWHLIETWKLYSPVGQQKGRESINKNKMSKSFERLRGPSWAGSFYVLRLFWAPIVLTYHPPPSCFRLQNWLEKVRLGIKPITNVINIQWIEVEFELGLSCPNISTEIIGHSKSRPSSGELNWTHCSWLSGRTSCNPDGV